MPMTSAEIFAARGDEWNARNEQVAADPRGWKRRSAFHGGGRELRDEIDGYEPVAASPRAAIRKREFVEDVARELDPNPRLAANAMLRARRQIREALRAR